MTRLLTRPAALRLALDAAIVVALGAMTAAFVRSPVGGWIYLVPDKEVIEKLQLDPSSAAFLLWQWWTATAVGMAAMLLRTGLPLIALAGTVAMSVVHTMSWTVPLLPVDLAALVALHTVAAQEARRWVSSAALAVTLGAAGFVVLWQDPTTAIAWGGWLLPPFAVGLAWLMGDRVRARRHESQQREWEKERQAELAVAAERSRISRDMHDAVAHGLSIMVIQAQAAAGALERRPAVARAALEAIESTGRHSLAEMRRLLGLTRPDEAELAPLPGLTDLPSLLDRVRNAGLPVTVTVAGRVESLPTGVSVSAYRIVQEGLTNALKHAGQGARVDLSVQCGSDVVELCIADNGKGVGGGPLDERRGGGLRGMRQRVELLGGSIAVGDRPGGGFSVRAHLPVPGVA